MRQWHRLRVNVKIADSPGERAHCLMNRTSMPQDAGMLLVYRQDVMSIEPAAFEGKAARKARVGQGLTP